MSLKQKIITGVVCSVVALLGVVMDKQPDLQTSEQGLAHILDMERCRLKAYQCSADRWTVGAGHAMDVQPNQTITLEQAADYFIDDVAKAEKVVRRAIKQTPTQGEWDMMVSFVFNTGAGNFKRLKNKKLIRSKSSQPYRITRLGAASVKSQMIQR